ncbi:MAG: hypothetical protein KC503_12235 [Myxococcales bacterium]|nr:hypothetical protein [Myxococcales bacterium]
MSENPYAPPPQRHDDAVVPLAGGADGGVLQLADGDWTTIYSLTRWMRIVFGLQIAGAILIALVLAATFTSTSIFDAAALAPYKHMLPLVMALVLVMVAYLVVGSIFLRRSAKQLHQGTADGRPRLLAAGFRSLRVYLVIYALYEVTNLASNLYRAFTRS